MATGFIILFDDGTGYCIPYGWDDDCEGAVCSFSSTVAHFETRAAARKAIEISTNWARLRKSMGDTFNDDFIGPKCRVNIRIVPLNSK